MADDLFTADVLGSDATDGEIRVHLGDASSGRGFSKDNPVYGPDGFIGRPNPPSADGSAAQAVYVHDGDDHRVLGVRDNRWKDKVGTMDDGDRAIVTEGAARIFVKNGRDAVVLYTEANDGKGMLLDIGGVEGEVQIINGKGGTFFRMGDHEIVLAVDGGGTLTIDAEGVRVTGANFQATAGSVQLGDMGGGTPPPALPPLIGVAYGPPGVGPPVTTASTKVFVAP